MVGVVAAVLLAGCDAGSRAAADPPYGTLPTYLPTSAATEDGVLVGSAARPALTAEGDAVDARLGAGAVRVTVIGPLVPGEGLPYQTPATTCTWTVTMAATRGAAPVRAADFSVVDHLGAVFRPVLAPGSHPPPAVRPGRPVTFRLRAVLPTGEGLMRWAPDSNHIVAKWDFVVEND